MNTRIYQVAGGSIPGRDHIGKNGLLIGKNNQDGIGWRMIGNDTVIAAVADGCGSKAHSDVGAQLGVTLMLSAVEKRLRRMSRPFTKELRESFWEAVRQDVLAQLRIVALAMAGESSFTEIVSDYFLFTMLVILATPDECQIVTVGDGVIGWNGEVIDLGPFPDNTPPYFAYPLIDTDFSDKPEKLRFSIDCTIPSKEVSNLIIGSDGLTHFMNAEERRLPGKSEVLGPLAQFWSEDRYFANSQAIRRRLVLANSETLTVDSTRSRVTSDVGLLPDDTTIVVVRVQPGNGTEPK